MRRIRHALNPTIFIRTLIPLEIRTLAGTTTMRQLWSPHLVAR
jgi:hypothetical protein